MLNIKFSHRLKLICCAFLVSYIHFNIGCTFAFASTFSAKLQEPTNTIKVNDEQLSWIASIPYLVCPIGLLVVGALTDAIGRRKALQVAYVPIIFGWLILANASSITAVIIGRTIIGTTMGCSTCAGLYLAEVSPTNLRPLFLSMSSVFVGVGMMVESMLAIFFHWCTLSAVLFVLSAVVCILLFLLPETPLWLRDHGRDAEAERAEMWFGVEPATRLTTEEHDDKEQYQCKQISIWSTYLHPTVWKPTLIMLAFFICQQGSGVYVLLLYSVDVLRDFQVSWNGLTVTVFLCVARVVGSLVFSLLHKCKRKTLMSFSSTGMAVSLILVIAHLKIFQDVHNPPFGGAILIIAVIAYVFFSLFAVLQLPWIISNEVFPMTVKGKMCGIVNIFGYELMFLTVKMYPKMISAFGLENVWIIFTVFCVLSALFGIFIMPETKGKSLDEILSSFESNKKNVIDHAA